MDPKAALSDLKWHVRYTHKNQNKRLKEYLDADETNTIGEFIHTQAEWQLDDLIRHCNIYLPIIETELKQLDKKPILERIQFWKK